MTPEATLAERLVRVNFVERRVRNAAGVPTVPPEYAADVGKRVAIIDVREDAELTGPLGHIPGAVRVPMAELARIPSVLGVEQVTVVVSNYTERAGRAALYLEALGMQYVAAMEGGMHQWKAMGLSTSRLTLFRGRKLERVPPPPPPPPDGFLTKELIDAHVGRRGNVKWMTLAAFLTRGRRSCVDGRDDSGVIGTPGGDMGELCLALAAWETATGATLEQAHIDALVQEWVDTFGRLYLHSDTGTINTLIPKLRADPRLTKALEPLSQPMHWRNFMRGPPREVQEAVLEWYLKPEAMGCGHLRLMTLYPERYGVRPGLVQQVMHGFWTTRWKGAPEPEYVVLGGGHAEGAVVNVTLDESLWTFSKVPLLSPNVDGLQMFVNHPQVAQQLRAHVAEFLLRVEGLLPVVPRDRGALIETVGRLGQQHLTATLSVLAAGLPVFEVCFHEGEEFTVTEVQAADPTKRKAH
ncbi:MAG: rhodanese-like domain-containing protein [Myxococcaceae bacterium]|nr:rhodanese-like domain-containing protein [Myxococcaceae bacterium]